MVVINFARREINCKLVYYGPALAGKTTNLEVIHQQTSEDQRGELTRIATEGDTTLFFDYRVDGVEIRGIRTKFQLYTVPGEVYYNATRKLVLQGANGVVFVADSEPARMEENVALLANLEENLREQGIDPRTIPMVFQWNKRDLPGALDLEPLRALNPDGHPAFEAVAVTGQGVLPAFEELKELVVADLTRQYLEADEEWARQKQERDG